MKTTLLSVFRRALAGVLISIGTLSQAPHPYRVNFLLSGFIIIGVMVLP